MLCGQMLNEHDRHASGFLEGMQELSKRFESTGRGADSHNCRRFGVGDTVTQLTGELSRARGTGASGWIFRLLAEGDLRDEVSSFF